jgi:NAD(P)H-hydrate epimerase
LLFEPGRSAAGAVRLVDIGIEPVSGGPTLVVLDATDVVLPVRVRDAHKWSAGLMVVAGSPGMLGAALLVSHAAARCGAGMVVSGLPADAARRVAGSEVVTRALPATPEGLLDEDAARLVLRDLGRFRALALGPGLGRDDRTQAAVRRLVAEAPVPVVVDADALHALGGDAAALRVRRTAGLPPAVLTPHAGEYVRLAGEAVGDDRVDAARRLAARLHAVVLLKGPGTVVASPEGHACVNTTDSELLATAGTGDVLTGMIGGLLAQGVDAFEAAASAAWLHGRAAQLAGTGDALVAGDLVDALPRTLASIDDRED